MKRKVLFLCTGNACRSQMAEAMVNHLYGERWAAFSAGTRPTGVVHPLAVRVLREIGIDATGMRSKSVDEFHAEPFDLVVTVCDSAAEECPRWLGAGRRVHIGFPDPAQATGSTDEVLRTFRAVRDDIRQEISRQLESNVAPN